MFQERVNALEPISRSAIAAVIATEDAPPAPTLVPAGTFAGPKPNLNPNALPGVSKMPNAAAILNEYAQRIRAIEPPKWTVLSASPTAGVTVKLEVEIGGQKFEEIFVNRDKKQAKNQAAEALLSKLLPHQSLQQIITLMRTPGSHAKLPGAPPPGWRGGPTGRAGFGGFRGRGYGGCPSLDPYKAPDLPQIGVFGMMIQPGAEGSTEASATGATTGGGSSSAEGAAGGAATGGEEEMAEGDNAAPSASPFGTSPEFQAAAAAAAANFLKPLTPAQDDAYKILQVFCRSQNLPFPPLKSVVKHPAAPGGRPAYVSGEVSMEYNQLLYEIVVEGSDPYAAHKEAALQMLFQLFPDCGTVEEIAMCVPGAAALCSSTAGRGTGVTRIAPMMSGPPSMMNQVTSGTMGLSPPPAAVSAGTVIGDRYGGGGGGGYGGGYGGGGYGRNIPSYTPLGASPYPNDLPASLQPVLSSALKPASSNSSTPMPMVHTTTSGGGISSVPAVPLPSLVSTSGGGSGSSSSASNSGPTLPPEATGGKDGEGVRFPVDVVSLLNMVCQQKQMPFPTVKWSDPISPGEVSLVLPDGSSLTAFVPGGSRKQMRAAGAKKLLHMMYPEYNDLKQLQTELERWVQEQADVKKAERKRRLPMRMAVRGTVARGAAPYPQRGSTGGSRPGYGRGNTPSASIPTVSLSQIRSL